MTLIRPSWVSNWRYPYAYAQFDREALVEFLDGEEERWIKGTYIKMLAIRRPDGDIAIRASAWPRSFDMATYHVGGSITIRMGQYPSPAIFNRLCDYLPGWLVWYKRKVTAVAFADGWHGADIAMRNNEAYAFQEGMTLHPDGTVSAEEPVKRWRETVLWLEKVQRFAKRSVELWVDNGLKGKRCEICENNRFNSAHLVEHINRHDYNLGTILAAMDHGRQRYYLRNAWNAYSEGSGQMMLFNPPRDNWPPGGWMKTSMWQEFRDFLNDQVC